MSAGEIIAALGLGLTVLGLLVAAAWWMSALFQEVKGVRADLRDYRVDHAREHDAVWAAIHQKADK